MTVERNPGLFPNIEAARTRDSQSEIIQQHTPIVDAFVSLAPGLKGVSEIYVESDQELLAVCVAMDLALEYERDLAELLNLEGTQSTEHPEIEVLVRTPIFDGEDYNLDDSLSGNFVRVYHRD